MDYKLFSQISDYEELDIFIMSLSLYLEDLDNFSLSKKENIEGNFSINMNPILKGIISNLYGDIFMDKNKMKSVYDSFEEIKKNVKIVDLTFNSDIDNFIKIKVKDFFQSKIDKDIIIRYKINPDIGGGIVIQTPSSFFDFSFDYVLKTNLDKIINIMKND